MSKKLDPISTRLLIALNRSKNGALQFHELSLPWAPRKTVRTRLVNLIDKGFIQMDGFDVVLLSITDAGKEYLTSQGGAIMNPLTTEQTAVTGAQNVVMQLAGVR